MILLSRLLCNIYFSGKGLVAAEFAHAAATGTAVATTTAETAAPMGLNSALLACPIFWIVAEVIALISVIVAVVRALNIFGAKSTSVFGTLTGCINVAMQFFVNLGLLVANVALGIWEALGACCENIGIAFHNVISGVKSWFYGLLSAALTVVEGICAALNRLPFVEFDYSGIAAKAQEYADKSAEASGSKKEYVSIADAFDKGYHKFDAFSDGWAKKAFDEGAAWGDGITDKFNNFLDSLKPDLPPSGGDESSGSGTQAMGNIPPYDPNDALGGNVSNIASNTGDIADTLDVTEEELEYLRDIAEQETVNRFTTAEISIDMSGMQNMIGNDMDLDGIIDGMIDGVSEAIEIASEGVHT